MHEVWYFRLNNINSNFTYNVQTKNNVQKLFDLETQQIRPGIIFLVEQDQMNNFLGKHYQKSSINPIQ